MIITLPAALPPFISARAVADAADVGDLDRRFQRAVKTNDVERIDAILHPSFALILGDGTVVTRAEILQEARDRVFDYEIQDEDPGTQMVRVMGRHRRRDCAPAHQGQDQEGREAVCAPALVQRHLCANAEGMALCVRPGIAVAAVRRFLRPAAMARCPERLWRDPKGSAERRGEMRMTRIGQDRARVP